MATLLKTDGTMETVLPENGKTFTLEELQKSVGGHIELVHTDDGKKMYINEEGKLDGLPLNRRASGLYSHMDTIVGDALIVEDSEEEEEETE